VAPGALCSPLMCFGWPVHCVRFQVHTAASMMMEAVRTSETSVDSHFTRQYNPEDNSERPVYCFYKMPNMLLFCVMRNIFVMPVNTFC
jgi:hypothetical protein